LIRDGETGFLAPLFDEAEFESRLSHLLNDEKLRAEMGKRAKLSIKDFALDKITDDFFQFIIT
jgi:glycosyltransferase involved in cell wall biosynthesis